MARRLARGMGSFFKDCGCARPTRCPPPYTIRFRNGLGKQLEEGGFDTQDDAIERLTQIYAEKKRTAPSVAQARRELGRKTVAEYAKQWRPRQRRMTEYSTGEHVNSSIDVHIVPRLGSRKLISVTPIVVERFLDELQADGVGRGNQVNILRTLKAILRDAYDKEAMADDPVKRVREPEYVRQKVVIPSLPYVKQAQAVAGDALALQIVMTAGRGLRKMPRRLGTCRRPRHRRRERRQVADRPTSWGWNIWCSPQSRSSASRHQRRLLRRRPGGPAADSGSTSDLRGLRSQPDAAASATGPVDG